MLHSFYNTLQRLSLTLIITSALIQSATAQVSALSARVDKNPVMADESIVLTVTAMGSIEQNAFNADILNDDFVVGRTSVSSQTRVVNFDTTRSTTWTTILIPRTEGVLDIPAFTVGGQSSEPIKIRVLPTSAASPAKAREAFITAEVDVKQPYVQQLVKYTVRIHLAIDLQRGSMAEPVLQNANIRPLGKDRDYTDIVDGQRYRIIERNYGIIPQSSGQVVIKGPLFEGEVIDKSRDSFSYFNQTKPINRVTPDITLDVKAIPSTVTEHWLPSEYVQLNEEWQPDLAEIKAGEPITRTLTLSVLGVAEEQLPEIIGRYPPDFKVYPDQPATTTVVRDGNLVAQRVENIAIIPSKAGNYVLPEVSVAWFNVLTGTTEYATLPARSIVVTPGAAVNPATPSPIPQSNQDTLTTDKPELPPTAQVETVEVTKFWSLSSWILLGVWLATLLLWFMSRKKISVAPTNTSPTLQSEKALWSNLTTALKTQQSNLIYPSLQHWLSHILHTPGASLTACQQRISSVELDHEINAMFADQFSQDDKRWKSDKLLLVLQRVRQSALEKNNKATLQPLY
ncbi:BatD family protein [Aliiglaciecola sp. LCG003]|uniref:BatD family protein n=1 Tax=Aliiglaciecola sp. LCG003 TaxID=3053655 RepID=UPI0025726BFE|nr:BatD family protein [Aliiglaciecola sp. LCG003]WJG10625.1 BatD family protein [Aliiglaciecola sp. LCG003]